MCILFVLTQCNLIRDSKETQEQRERKDNEITQMRQVGDYTIFVHVNFIAKNKGDKINMFRKAFCGVHIYAHMGYNG